MFHIIVSDNDYFFYANKIEFREANKETNISLRRLSSKLLDNIDTKIMPPSTNYTRPGVDAAVRLSQMIYNNNDLNTWNTIEKRYKDMMELKGGIKLLELDLYCEQLMNEYNTRPMIIFNKHDLMQLIQWKFTKGKPRYPLIKQIESNSDETIQQCIKNAFMEASKTSTVKNANKQAIEHICQLKGIGPATASAILSLYQPHIYSFMDDEIIEALYEKKRGYTIPIYLAVNERCIQISDQLNSLSSSSSTNKYKKDSSTTATTDSSNVNILWTPRRVGQTLWTAAKLASTENEVDITLLDSKSKSSNCDKSSSDKEEDDDDDKEDQAILSKSTKRKNATIQKDTVVKKRKK